MSKRAKRNLIFIFLALILLNVLILASLKSASPVIVDYGNARVKTLATFAVNNAVLKTLNDYGYDDFVMVEKDSEGKITCLKANSMLMNNLARVVAVSVQNELAEISSTGVSIPLGNLSGMAVFTGLGPDLNFKLQPYESVVCEFVSEFTAAGINQTRHRIILRVVSSMNLIVPTANTVITNNTDIILAETVLVGLVPDVYLDFG